MEVPGASSGRPPRIIPLVLPRFGLRNRPEGVALVGHGPRCRAHKPRVPHWYMDDPRSTTQCLGMWNHGSTPGLSQTTSTPGFTMQPPPDPERARRRVLTRHVCRNTPATRNPARTPRCGKPSCAMQTKIISAPKTSPSPAKKPIFHISFPLRPCQHGRFRSCGAVPRGYPSPVANSSTRPSGCRRSIRGPTLPGKADRDTSPRAKSAVPFWRRRAS